MLSASPVSMVTARQELGTLAAVIACDSRVSVHSSPSTGVALRVLEGRQADDVEGKISLRKELAPVGDHHRKNSAVLIAAWRVLLALVPERAGDRERRDGLQHSFVKNGRHDGPVLVGDGQRLRRARIHAELALPFARQRNDRSCLPASGAVHPACPEIRRPAWSSARESR